MNDLLTFQAFCKLLMCDDPTNLKKNERFFLEKWANQQARDFGFNDWIEAYHFNLKTNP